MVGVKRAITRVFVLQIETGGPLEPAWWVVWAASAQRWTAAENLKGWVHGFHRLG